MRRPFSGALLATALLVVAGSANAKPTHAPAPNLVHNVNSAGESLPVVRATLRLIRDKYVDAARVPARELLVGALRQIELEVEPVLVTPTNSGREVVVSVEANRRMFRIDDIHGPWDVAARLSKVFAFLRSELVTRGPVDLRALEFAACAGLREGWTRMTSSYARHRTSRATSTNTQT